MVFIPLVSVSNYNASPNLTFVMAYFTVTQSCRSKIRYLTYHSFLSGALPK